MTQRLSTVERVGWRYGLAVSSAGAWFNFSDCEVEGPLLDSEVVTPETYVLFFQRGEEAQQDAGALVSPLLHHPGVWSSR